MSRERTTARSIVIEGGRVVGPIDSFNASVLIEDGTIKAVGRHIEVPRDAERFDARGMLVLPGAVDVRTHVGVEHSGHESSGFGDTAGEAALGGVTTFMAHAYPVKGQSLPDAVDAAVLEATGVSHVDFAFHAGFTRIEERSDGEIADLVELGAPSLVANTGGIDDPTALGDDELYGLLLESSREGALVSVRSETGWLTRRRTGRLAEKGRLGARALAASRPSYAEGEAVARTLRAAFQADAPVCIANVSTGEALTAAEEAIDLGVDVYCQTASHYLVLDEDLLQRSDGHRFATLPPLRGSAHREALWQGIEDGFVQVVASDHCSFTADEKDEGSDDFRRIPPGVPSIGTLLPVLWTAGVREGRMTENELVDLIATQPSEIFGLYPRKGAIREGADADLVILDPELTLDATPDVVGGHSDYAVYDAGALTGWPVATMVRGVWVVENRRLVGAPSHGAFVPRKTVCQRPGVR
ncbi:MAG: amidohydrolase family protein [Candidatus Eisenbacteria bacterium]|nr:amidohydrolase family protein [Candidatus Eisenbacteria bacterium]